MTKQDLEHISERKALQAELDQYKQDPNFIQFLDFMRVYQSMPEAMTDKEADRFIDEAVAKDPTLAGVDVVAERLSRKTLSK